MKIYDAKEFQTLLDSMTKRTTEIGDPLLNLEQAVQKIVSLDSFTGNGPEALKSFYQNSHLPLLRYWQMVNEKRTNLISSLKKHCVKL